MTVAILSHPDCILHDAGELHPEQPDRIKVIQKAIEIFPFKKTIKYIEAPLAKREQLLAVHDESYVDWIISIAPTDEMIGIDNDTMMNPYTLNAALRAAGANVSAVDLVMKKKAQAAFCNIRPPGHHAEYEKAMGFCIFNNVAIGVMHALDVYHLERIAIIDFDVHHGNGTQNIFQSDERVMLCSSFEHPLYPGYDEELDNEHLLNVPLPAGTAGPLYREKVAAAWFDQLSHFQPQFIFFSAGFDGHANDPLANLCLQREDYVWLTQQIAKIAKVHCNGRMVSTLEGGYNLSVLADCVPAHINAMLI